MARLAWDEVGKKFYEIGVDRGVLYTQATNGIYEKGVAWNGLITITESPSGAEANPIYADNIKYLSLMSAEELGVTIEAYTYPVEFEKCDGSITIANGVNIGQQDRCSFGLAYRTLLGNDINKNNHGYKIHLLYGAMASPSEKGYSSINDSIDASTFSWEVTTTPVTVQGHKPTALVTIDSTKIPADKLKQLEDILYGKDNVEPRLPLPDEIITLVGSSLG